MMNPAAVRMFIQNALAQPRVRGLSTDNLGVYVKVLNSTSIPIEMLEAGLAKIAANSSLSDAGKISANGALATSMLKEFVFQERSVSALDKSISGTPIFDVVSPITDAVLRQMRNAEVRAGLRGLTEPERDNQFLLAAQQDQDEVLDALLDAPGGMLCSADRKRRGLQERAKRKQPQAYAKWKDDVLLHKLVCGLRNLVATCFISLGVDPQKVLEVLGTVGDTHIEEDTEKDAA